MTCLAKQLIENLQPGITVVDGAIKVDVPGGAVGPWGANHSSSLAYEPPTHGIILRLARGPWRRPPIRRSVVSRTSNDFDHYRWRIMLTRAVTVTRPTATLLRTHIRRESSLFSNAHRITVGEIGTGDICVKHANIQRMMRQPHSRTRRKH